MPKWFAVHDQATGELRSIGTVVADAAHLEAHGLVATELGDEAPDQHTHRWHPSERRFVPRVVKDRLDDLATDPAFAELGELLRTLPKGQADKLKAGLATLLGPRRYRQDDEPTALG